VKTALGERGGKKRKLGREFRRSGVFLTSQSEAIQRGSKTSSRNVRQMGGRKEAFKIK